MRWTSLEDTVSRVREIEKMISEQCLLKVFDDNLFSVLVERIRVKSLVEVMFVLKAGVEVREVKIKKHRKIKKLVEKKRNSIILP